MPPAATCSSNKAVAVTRGGAVLAGAPLGGALLGDAPPGDALLAAGFPLAAGAAWLHPLANDKAESTAASARLVMVTVRLLGLAVWQHRMGQLRSARSTSSRDPEADRARFRASVDGQ